MTTHEQPRCPEPDGEASREEWGRFLSGLVHELKTPLTSLGMIAQLLGRNGAHGLGETETRYVRNLGELTREMQSLVNDAGVLARLWSGARPVRRKPGGLAELVARVEDSARGRGWERGVSLVALLGPDLPREIRTDPVLLEEALGGLLETALVLAEEHVSLRVSATASEVAFTVGSDGGCGRAEDIAALFDPFQGASARKLHGRGGRSLAPLLARELASALGGDVFVDAVEGRTSCVLRLPLAG